ncbi:tRNA (5-methylaminomethyl-2-thiouridine)(34)-methyltransferase MnmD [Anaerolineales bacterium HSG24]|nr:tRNA (5-methylaminomethyl-2-thiouridine)(34)-methyltransferase MnmD [Anaerolineales bacterium HSG24]
MNSHQIEYTPQQTADGVDTLYSPIYNQTYHSKHGALREAEHVFLVGTGVKQRLLDRQPTRILEVGFGTGLNFLLTAYYSQTHRTPFHYVALENLILPDEILTALNYGEQLQAVEPIRQKFLWWRRNLPVANPVGEFRSDVSQHIRLVMKLGDATTSEIRNESCHAIYHDPFSPTVNPELWTESFFSQLYGALKPEGKLATYSVKGTVRRALQSVGFEVQKRHGPPGKREVLVATKPVRNEH